MQTHKPLNDPTKVPTIKDTIWVVAGNYNQYYYYVANKRREGDNGTYNYVYSPDSIRGLSKIQGVFIGTWKERKDIIQIQEMIRQIKEWMKVSVSHGILAQEIVPVMTGTITGTTQTNFKDTKWFEYILGEEIENVIMNGKEI